jgi:hypothetical protein
VKRVIVCSASLLAVLAVAGCDTNKDTRPDRAGTALAQQSYQWSADPSIDLLSGPAVPLRAYLESRLDSQTMGDPAYAYPGFDGAVAQVTEDDRDDILKGNLRSDATKPVEGAAVGDNLYHVQSITRDGDAVTATVCNYRYRLAHENADGTFRSLATTFANDDGIDVQRVIMTAPGDPGTLPPQEGPEAAPADDVFGGWKITGVLDEFVESHPAFAGLWPTYNADLAKCVAEAPDSPERRAFLSNGNHPRDDFPTSPPSPGWPGPVSN